VAVKIINENLKGVEGAPLEAVLGVSLRHPHVVTILKVWIHCGMTAG
jgi:hypothetical protein